MRRVCQYDKEKEEITTQQRIPEPCAKGKRQGQRDWIKNISITRGRRKKGKGIHQVPRIAKLLQMRALSLNSLFDQSILKNLQNN
jgi:hypothetical protein